MWPGDLPSISDNFPFRSWSFCQLQNILRAARKPSVIFRQLSVYQETFRQLLSTFRATGRHSLNFHQLSAWLGEILSTTVNIPCSASRPLSDIREGLLTTPGHSGGPLDHSQTLGKASQPLPNIREGLLTTPAHQGGPPDQSRTSGKASRPLKDIRDALPTTP